MMLPERYRVHLLFQECWTRLNREGATQASRQIRETGRAYVSLFAEKYIDSPFVHKDLMSATRMVDALVTIALCAWRTRHSDAGSEEIYQRFLEVPFSQWIDSGVALYQQVIGDPSETDWTEDNHAVAMFARDYPVFLSVREDVKTLERVASALGFGNGAAFCSVRDSIIEQREEGQILVQSLRSVMAGVAMGLKKPWLALYPDGMLEILRTLYLDRANGLDAPWTRAHLPEAALEMYLSNCPSVILTVQDHEMLAACMQRAVIELQRLWDDPGYLSEMLACPGPEEKTFFAGKPRFFRTDFFDTGQMMFDGDHCAGTREWDLAAFSIPAWVVFLEKASGILFDGDEEDDDALMDYMRSLCAQASDHPLQWELASSFILTDAPWVPIFRKHFTMILDTLKQAMTVVVQEHACSDDHIRATIADMNRLEFGPLQQD